MGKSEEDYQRLFSATYEGWDAIGEEAVVNLIKSIPRAGDAKSFYALLAP